jgi:hypothetical protein
MFFMLKARAGGAGWLVSSAKPEDIMAIATIPARSLRELRKDLGDMRCSCQMTGWGIHETIELAGPRWARAFAI